MEPQYIDKEYEFKVRVANKPKHKLKSFSLSLPEPTVDRFRDAAKSDGMSQAEFFTKTMEIYLINREKMLAAG